MQSNKALETKVVDIKEKWNYGTVMVMAEIYF
jgi:hypothetical protein